MTAATTGAYAVNGSPGTAVVNSRPMAGPPGPSPQRSPQSFTRPVADNIDRLMRWLLLMRGVGISHVGDQRGVGDNSAHPRGHVKYFSPHEYILVSVRND